MDNPSNFKNFEKDLDILILDGEMLSLTMQYECFPIETKVPFIKKLGKAKAEKFFSELKSFNDEYQKWYSESLVVIKLMLPDRFEDFIRLYKKIDKRKEITNENYVIDDYIQGLTVTRGWNREHVVGQRAALPRFRQQLNILKSVKKRFKSSLFDILQVVQADLFDTELETATELNKKGFARGAGAIAGVVLEAHLKQVCDNHNLVIKKNNPSISDFNDLLKKSEVIEVATWRFIQLLSDLRNLCDHKKTDDPTKDQVDDLIEGCGKIIRTIF